MLKLRVVKARNAKLHKRILSTYEAVNLFPSFIENLLHGGTYLLVAESNLNNEFREIVHMHYYSSTPLISKHSASILSLIFLTAVSLSLVKFASYFCFLLV